MNVPPADPSQQHDTLLPFGNGEIASVALSLYSAPKGQNRPVDAYVVTECEGNFTGSARRAAETVYGLAQKRLPRIEPMVVGFDIQGISPGTSPVTGESGGLAFAIALAGKLFQNNPGPVAATGVIVNSGGDGPIGRVDGIAAKLTAAANRLPEHGRILYPAENSGDVPESVFTLAKQRQISLHPVSSGSSRPHAGSGIHEPDALYSAASAGWRERFPGLPDGCDAPTPNNRCPLHRRRIPTSLSNAGRNRFD